jgi:mediator of replication checkpoint protein 1
MSSPEPTDASPGRDLSPWSKIRAMVRAPAGPADSPTRRSSRSNPASNISDGSSSGSDSDDVPRRPVGGMAARLMASKPISNKGENVEKADEPSQTQESLVSNVKSTAERKQSLSEPSTPASSVSKAAERRPVASPSLVTPQKEPDSPGLFVSSRRETPATSRGQKFPHASDSDSDALPSITSARFQELVAKKRAERKAREEEKAKTAEAKRAALSERSRKKKPSEKNREEEEDDDSDADRRMTQQSRPARKASKKALEEMNRETQRLARNQQLTYQAKVKRKITTDDLFRKFNFRQQSASQVPAESSPTRGELVMLDGLASSDNENHTSKDTPPTSPPAARLDDEPEERKSMIEDEYVIHTGPDANASQSGDDLPSIEQLLSRRQLNKGKAPIRNSDPTPSPAVHSAAPRPKAPKTIRVLTAKPKARSAQLSDSDDDLEIVDAKKSRFAVFDQMPAKKAAEHASLLNLRALAHLKSPGKARPKGRQSLTTGELQLKLAQQARQQAISMKQEKIKELRAKGIVIQTDEEREKEQLELENLLEKARQEALELAKKEKSAAKRDGETGENVLISDDEDEEFEASDEEDEDDANSNVEVSGSEEELNEEAEEDDEEPSGNPLFDEAADEADDDEDDLEEESGVIIEEDGSEAEEDAIQNAPAATTRQRQTRKRIIDDDDDDREVGGATIPNATPTQPASTNALAAFGFENPKTSPVGLTQMFKGTMADLGSQPMDAQAPQGEEDSLDFLRQQFPPTFPDIPSTLTEDSQAFIRDSQLQEESMVPIDLGLSQFPSHQANLASPTKVSEIEPTQDAGFEQTGSVTGKMAPQSTVDTVVMPDAESPILKKKGRLRRLASMVAEFSDNEDNVIDDVPAKGKDFELSTDAFRALFKGAKKRKQREEFDKKKSGAKNMVAEQAEESEDEYAGLGGASDDDTDSEVDEEVAKMIDETHVDVDVAELAQLFADKDRADDEKRVDKLYRDITTGMLRRKRGADLDDLSDSDDEAAERRRRKQLEFARMRKALLEDEHIGKIGKFLVHDEMRHFTDVVQPRIQRSWRSCALLKIVMTTRTTRTS